MDNPQEIKREKVRVVTIKFIDDFPDHPCFGEMRETQNNLSQ